MKNFYFDYNSNTPIEPEVHDVINQTMKLHYGNPSSIHIRGRQTRDIIEKSRTEVALLIGASSNEIFFTSGGSESNNWAIKGLDYLYRQGKNHIISATTEHSSVYETLKDLERKGIDVTFLTVDGCGRINTGDLQDAINDRTALVSLMLANNETGVIENIAEISKITGERGILLHSDAVQAVGKIPVNIQELSVDLLSLSSHKIYGPMGIGALYIKKGLTLTPLIHGGGQENKRRSGTENVPAIAGFGEASRICRKNYQRDTKHLLQLKNRLYTGLIEKINFSKLNGSLSNSLPNTLNMSFPGCESDTLVLDLDSAGFQVSAGAACGSSGSEKSRVLKAMNLKANEIYSSIRFSIGRYTLESEIIELIDTLADIVSRYRNI